MSPPVDMFVMGAALGVGAGFALGYATRAMRSLVQRHGDEVRDINQYKPAFVSLPRHEQLIPVDEPRARRVPAVKTNEGRSTVIDALTSAGYKKTVAATAVDACAEVERSSVERWTVAALQKAMRL